MPEGHTLHRLALDLDHAFAGREVEASSPQGRFTESAAILDGSRLVAASAHGKHLFCDFDVDGYTGEDRLVLHVHLGLIGKFTLSRPSPPRGAVRLRLATADTVADLRGAIVCTLRTPAEVSALVAGLGPDPLRDDADPELAWRRIQRSNRTIAALLMDQAVLSGVGNVYRAEVLFRNRVKPHQPGARLTRRSWLAIWADLVELMPRGVRARRIQTLRPEDRPSATGRPREYGRGASSYVYRRAGEPCRICGSKVRTEVLAGRNLFWCANCQRRG